MKSSLIITLLSIFTVGTVSAATLVPKRGVSILYINGQASESKIGENQIDEGFNQIVVRMDKDMSKGSSSDVFTSKPFAISLTVTGENVVIDHPVARSMAEAKIAFQTNDPKWSIKQDGKPLNYQQSMIKGGTGFLPFSGLEKRVAEHNAKNGIYFENGKLLDKPVETIALDSQQVAAVAATGVATTAVVEKTKANTNQKPVVAKQTTQNLDQLKAWYLKSSKEERKEFRRWMIDQE